MRKQNIWPDAILRTLVTISYFFIISSMNMYTSYGFLSQYFTSFINLGPLDLVTLLSLRDRFRDPPVLNDTVFFNFRAVSLIKALRVGLGS
jgi:hypothetical protein